MQKTPTSIKITLTFDGADPSPLLEAANATSSELSNFCPLCERPREKTSQ